MWLAQLPRSAAMHAGMKIAILTGGGDVPGLNSAIQGLAKGAFAEGFEAVGIRSGWQGLVALDARDAVSRAAWTVALTAENVRTLDRFGGTFLHTSRTNPSHMKQAGIPAHLAGVQARYQDPQKLEHYDLTPHVLDNLAHLDVDVLVAIGGDDTLSYADRLHREGFAVVGIPKTMDNDVFGTDLCLGFATCVARSVGYLHQLRTCAGSHERIGVVEVMGRNSGASCLIPSYLANVDRAIIAEVPCDVDRLAQLVMQDRRQNPSGYAMVTVSEGATLVGGGVIERGEADAYGHRKLGGIGETLGAKLQHLTGSGIILQNLGYLVRSGPPDALDVMLTFNYANLALELIKAKKFGQLVRLKDGRYGHAPLSIVSEGKKNVETDLFYDAEHYKPRIKSVLDLPMYLR